MKREKSGDFESMELDADEGKWEPTPHGVLLGSVLADNPEVGRGRDVLGFGGGVGNHTILLLRQGAAHVTTTEFLESRSNTTGRNVDHNCPEAESVEYRVADWLDTEGQFDVLVTTRPFALSGKRNRRYFIDSLTLDAHKRLRPEGELSFVQSSMADIQKTHRRLKENSYTVEILGSSEGPLRDYYLADKVFMREIQTVEDSCELRNGTYDETLFVVKAPLTSWTKPEGGH